MPAPFNSMEKMIMLEATATPVESNEPRTFLSSLVDRRLQLQIELKQVRYVIDCEKQFQRELKAAAASLREE